MHREIDGGNIKEDWRQLFVLQQAGIERVNECLNMLTGIKVGLWHRQSCYFFLLFLSFLT